MADVFLEFHALSLEEAHEAVYYLYNRAEELWSLLSSL